MITLNNMKFAESEDELGESLFHEGGTACGFYKVFKKEVRIFDFQKNLIGAVVSQGFVANATLLENGEIWYSYGTPEFLERNKKYRLCDQSKDIDNIAVTREWVGSELRYTFK